MATVKVRLKDASGNVLHPETDWYVVKNRPSITVDSNREIWGTSGSSIRLGANNIYVKDSKRSYEVLLADYPINWSAISGKPDYLVSKNEMFLPEHISFILEDARGERARNAEAIDELISDYWQI